MYAIIYQEDLDEFKVVEGDRSNCSELTVDTYRRNAEELAFMLNNFIAKGRCDVKKCKICGLYFFVERDEEDWFKRKGWQLPKRCKLCRDNKKSVKPIHDGSNCYVRDENNQWTRASMEVFRYEAMKHQPNGCSCARDYQDCWACSVSGDACLFLNPDAKACAERYQEGPLALKH